MKKRYTHIIAWLKKKQTVILFLLIFSSFAVHAQMDIQLNTYWQNPYYITPAYINDVQSLVFTFATRKQWANFNGAPVTFYASVASFIEEKNTQLGLRVFHDKFGYTSVTDASLVYAYNLKISGEWWANLGVSAAFQSLDYDLSKISFEGEEESDVYTDLTSEKGVNADVGMEVYNSSFRFGLAGRNLISLFKSGKTIYPNVNYIYGLYRQHTTNPVDFGGGLFGIQYGNRFQLEANATAYFKMTERDRDVFHTGIYYRTQKEIGAIVGVNISPSIGLSYSYGYNFGFNSFRIGQTHEVMLTYKLDPKPVERWDLLRH